MQIFAHISTCSRCHASVGSSKNIRYGQWNIDDNQTVDKIDFAQLFNCMHNRCMSQAIVAVKFSFDRLSGLSSSSAAATAASAYIIAVGEKFFYASLQAAFGTSNLRDPVE
ncbi:hypothetical protein Tsp_07522 [Trichinella spiralis]|uniref:hypothetical protein n=1 Tax=Trichinella spiralis TaxID=6334 RepID=UPI0001EFB3AD|nr:hypothetical protein Tsp_07522 [Trichinella spiralis]